MKMLLAMLPTIALTAYCQLIVKWRVSVIASTLDGATDYAGRAMRYLLDPFILSGFICSLCSAIAWLYVAERYPVSIAFPAYVGVLFAIVTLGSAVALNEAVSPQQLVGLALILGGVTIVSRAA